VTQSFRFQLFVEDDAMNRRVVKDMLGVADVEMAETPEAETGLQMVSDNDYDLILMDLRMPGMDGLTAIRHIRARGDAKAKLPVIVVTADTGLTIRQDCLGAGADEVIMKPVAMDLLFDAIGRMLASGEGDAAVLS
jgi:CheY-like chemotaxis protein